MSQIVARIEITLDSANQLKVTGQFDSLVTAYGLLEMAKGTIQKQTEQQQRIAAPDATALAMVSGKH
ncbi:MAG TPA: hypothetical protein VF456_20295 [Vicinamibacterales bacterium]